MKSPMTRALELYQSGVPKPFHVYAALYSADCHELELMVHKDLCDDRLSYERQFFRIEAEDAYEALKACQRYQLAVDDNWQHIGDVARRLVQGQIG